MSEMRILTVRNPWAWAIIHGGKDVENRVRNIAGDYRGTVAIHAAKSFGTMTEYAHATRQVSHLVGGLPNGEIAGAIVGVVDLVDVHRSGMECSLGSTPCHEYNLCSPWAEPYSEHLELANPRPLAEPIPFKGALGLRRLDEKTIALIQAQLEETK